MRKKLNANIACRGELPHRMPCLSYFMLSIKQLNKKYNQKKSQPVAACRDVDLHIPEGSVTALLGASGCGKSTLLKLIAGFEEPDSGEITLGSKILSSSANNISPAQREIGLVFQDALLFPNLDVEQNVGYAAKDKRLVQELIISLGLEGLEKRRSWELSGGQIRRTAIARALASDPKLMLLDEPFTGLDTALRADVRDEVFRCIKERGKTSLLVTHDPDDAFTVADQIILMDKGRIVAKGKATEVYLQDCPIESASLLGPAFALEEKVAMLLGLTIRQSYRPENISPDNLNAIKGAYKVSKESFYQGRKLQEIKFTHEGEEHTILSWAE